jgi:hypothetical protein
MALDLDFQHFQTMWPWLAELSLLNAVLSIFTPAERERRTPPVPRVMPWFYINIVLERFQALLPITRDLLDVDAAVSQVPLPLLSFVLLVLSEAATCTHFCCQMRRFRWCILSKPLYRQHGKASCRADLSLPLCLQRT